MATKYLHGGFAGIREPQALRDRFAKNLQSAIRSVGLTPKSAALVLGFIGKNQLYQTVRARWPLPDDESIAEMARILDVDVDRFFSWAGRIAPDVFEVLVKHPVLCKKIRDQGADALLTTDERRLDRELSKDLDGEEARGSE